MADARQSWDDPEFVGETQKPNELAFGESRGAYAGDKYFYRIVAVSLGGTLASCVLGAIGLTAYGKEVPDILMALGSAAVGAIAGVLVDTRQET